MSDFQVPQLAWRTVKIGNESLEIPEKTSFNLNQRYLYSQIYSLSGRGQPGTVLNGPLNGGGQIISNLTNSANPESTEAVTFGTAQNYFGTFRPTVKYVSGNYTVQAADGTIHADATAGPLVVYLPASNSVTGKIFPVVKVDGTANTVTVAAVGTDTVNGTNFLTLSSQWQATRPQSNGSGYISI